jgi:hypothetical protein
MSSMEPEPLTVRGEIQKALECLDGDDAPDSKRQRETLVRYLRRALLLLTGTTSNQIAG